MKVTLYEVDNGWSAGVEEHGEVTAGFQGSLVECLSWVGAVLNVRTGVPLPSRYADPDCTCDPVRANGLPWYAHQPQCAAREGLD